MRLPGWLSADTAQALGLLALAWGGSALIATAPPNYDSAWYMVATARVLDGARFGSDIIETNPPLFLLFTAFPTLLARAFGADAYTLFCFFVGALIAVSAFFSARSMACFSARSMACAELSCRRQILFGVGLVVLQTLVAGLSYGQREAVMLALALPFILNEAARLTADTSAPRVESMTWAGAAAIGFLTKPFYAFVPAGLILARALKERRIAALFSPPYLLMLTLAIAYAGLVVWLAPDWVDLLPDIVSAYPAGYNPPLRFVAIAFAQEGALGALAITCVWIMGGRFRNLALVLIAAGALFYLGSLMQLKGWPNHMLPGRLMLSIGLFVSALGLEAPRPTGLAAAGAAVALVLALLVQGIAGAGVFRRDDVRRSATAAVVMRAGDGAFLVISPAIQSAFPLVM